MEENIKRNFPNFLKNFWNDIEKGLVDCESIEEFENISIEEFEKLSQFYENVSLDNDTRSFVQYFKKYKEETLSSTMSWKRQ